MSRTKRQYNDIRVYHIIFRGIDRQDIFLENKDKEKFLQILKDEKQKYYFELYSYCLMDNHIHMVVFDEKQQLSKIMQSIAIRYSIYFNKKYDRIGHLFQDRYFSKIVEDREYFVQLCRYIHQNPVKAGISKTEEYIWSSYNEYIDNAKIIDTKLLFNIFSTNLIEAKQEFIKFHQIISQFEKEYKDVEIIDKLKINDKEAITIICDKLNIKNVKEILNLNNNIRNEKIAQIKKIEGLSNRQLARILGINRKIIDRAE